MEKLKLDIKNIEIIQKKGRKQEQRKNKNKETIRKIIKSNKMVAINSTNKLG